MTVGAFKKFVQATGFELEGIWFPRAPTAYSPLSKDDDYPIDFLTWEEAIAYCRWMGGRLPTEAEWEYAARAGSREPLYGSLCEIAWNSRGHPVGQKLPNAWGLHDPIGNVQEWCSDFYDSDYYRQSALLNLRGPVEDATRKEHVQRGGSALMGDSSLRVSYRTFGRSMDKTQGRKADYHGCGFRCALDSLWI